MIKVPPLRRGNFFTSRVHLNPTISTQVKYFALLRNIHSCLNLVRQSAADLMGSGAFSGKLLQSHILLDPCTINCVAVVVILPDEVVRHFQQDFQSC